MRDRSVAPSAGTSDWVIEELSFAWVSASSLPGRLQWPGNQITSSCGLRGLLPFTEVQLRSGLSGMCCGQLGQVTHNHIWLSQMSKIWWFAKARL